MAGCCSVGSTTSVVVGFARPGLPEMPAPGGADIISPLLPRLVTLLAILARLGRMPGFSTCCTFKVAATLPEKFLCAAGTNSSDSQCSGL